MEKIIEHLYILPILLFSVIVHEISHGYMALRLGDPTAKMMGRLTFNPIPHIDPIGSVLVPLFSLFMAGQIFIAWAKPVPVNPMNFSNFKRDDILVSVVGPLSNIALAFVCALAFILAHTFTPLVQQANIELLTEMWGFLNKMFLGGLYLNVILAVFNMLPIPPLDGSHVVASLLPDSISEQYRNIGFFGIFIVILLMRVDAFRTIFFGIINTIAFPFLLLINILT
ncbi:MAG: site-2 protease family protein [Bacteroidota bacterium]|nr:site-2 protease family protein [Bacteroidota bacterium]